MVLSFVAGDFFRIVLLIILGVAACSQLQLFSNGKSMYFNQQLHDELLAMKQEDKRVLQELFETGELPSEKYHPVIKSVHEKNTAKLKEIIAKYGWPGIPLVGKEGATSAWLIAQHAVSDTDFMVHAVELLEVCVAKKEVEGWQLAFLQDRINTMAGREQVYGTQFDSDEKGWPIPFPILDPENVNYRRLSENAIFPKLCVMLKKLSSEYQPYACGNFFRKP